jgi:hypothetical protein
MSNVDRDPNGVFDVPFGGGGGGSLTETIVSKVGCGAYLNVFLSVALGEKAKKNVKVRVGFKDDKPDVLLLQPVPSGHTLREKSGERAHFVISTRSFGGEYGDGAIKGRPVESWEVGEMIYVRIGEFFTDGGGQR